MKMICRRNRFFLLFFAAVALMVCCGHPSSLHALAAVALLPTEGDQLPSLAAQPGETQIGGEPVVHLKRHASAPPTRPEFTSATILPGRGMNLFQVSAYVPGKGEVQVLASPSMEEAAKLLSGGPEDPHGVKSFTLGGAFLVPYPNRIRGKLTADGKNIVTEWNGRALTLPAVWKGKAPNAELHAIHGLILDRKADSVKVENTPDGQKITGVIHAGDFGGYWPSKTDLTIEIALSGSAVEATIVAKNVGTEAEPMSIGWHPYFNIPSGDRTQARLHLPAAKLAEVNNYDDVFPTGKLVPVAGAKYDFTAPEGRAFGDIYLDDNFSQLSRTGGKVRIDLTDPAAQYGIHIDGISDNIRTIQVYAPPEKPFAAIEDQLNFADPFSNVWKGMDTGMATLQPNQSVTWKVRLELFTPAK